MDYEEYAAQFILPQPVPAPVPLPSGTPLPPSPPTGSPEGEDPEDPEDEIVNPRDPRFHNWLREFFDGPEGDLGDSFGEEEEEEHASPMQQLPVVPEEDREPFWAVATQNGSNLLNTITPFGQDVGAFLRRPEVAPAIHPVTMTSGEISEHFEISLDIDGVVVELSKVSSIKAQISYIFVPEVVMGGHQLKWPSLKKHVPIQEMSAEVLREWTHVYGSTLAYPDGGWQLHWALVPSSLTEASGHFRKDDSAKSS